MAIRDLAGTGALQDTLETTNVHLTAVLSELQETNGQRLELLAVELRSVNDKLERLLQHFEQNG